MRRAIARLGAALSILSVACGGHTARTLKMRTALDEGDPKRAIAALDDEMDIDTPGGYPKKVEGDDALLVLDRASIRQSIADFKGSKNDLEVADKAIDLLDLSHTTADDLGKYMFSDSAGRYQAPPYEKLFVNTLNMVNYLELADLNGARVEARRFAVMQKYLRDKANEKDSTISGLGSYLAGFVYEKSGEADEALRYYDDALAFGHKGTLSAPVARMAKRGSYTSPRLKAAAEGESGDPIGEEEGELLIFVGYGRVPHKIANRLPIGLVLTYYSLYISSADRATANQMAITGALTWVNFPSLSKDLGMVSRPDCTFDGKPLSLDGTTDVSAEVRRQWQKIEGSVVASALTRLITRAAVGVGTQAAGKGIAKAAGASNEAAGVIGALAAIGAVVGMTAADTPDTRSWETLPARVAVLRKIVPAGKHSLSIQARGWSRTQTVTIPKGGWATVSLMALN